MSDMYYYVSILPRQCPVTKLVRVVSYAISFEACYLLKGQLDVAWITYAIIYLFACFKYITPEF